jgi:hypothetical protein
MSRGLSGGRGASNIPVCGRASPPNIPDFRHLHETSRNSVCLDLRLCTGQFNKCNVYKTVFARQREAVYLMTAIRNEEQCSSGKKCDELTAKGRVQEGDSPVVFKEMVVNKNKLTSRLRQTRNNCSSKLIGFATANPLSYE